MSTTYIYILLASIFTSLVSLVGILVIWLSRRGLSNLTVLLVSLSAGTLLGDSFIHLLPEIFEESAKPDNIWWGVIAGIMIFFILEKIIHWRHCHLPVSAEHPHPIGVMNLVGDGLHNLIDGLVIGGSFLLSIPLGVATTVAVIAHEIPQELGDFGTLLHAGYKTRKALALNLLSGLASIVGAALAIIIGFHVTSFINWIIPITAGGFIYIATSDLIPELKKDSRIRGTIFQIFGIGLGLVLMLLLKIFSI